LIILFGASGVLGRSVTKALNSKGLDFAVTTNSRNKETKEYLKNKYIKPKFIQKCDVSKPEDVKKVFKAAQFHGKPITGVINNFAITYQKSNRLTEKQKKKIFDVNYFGVVNILENLLSYKKQREQISVVNVLSNSLKTLNASNEHYISSKAAVEVLSKYYASHFGSKIRVNCVAPGLMLSNLTKKRFNKNKKKIIEKTPLKRLIHPDEVSETIINILTQLNGMNGEIIFIDGGRTIKLHD